MLEIPEIIVIGNFEMLLAGIAFGAGFPELGIRIVNTARGRRATYRNEQEVQAEQDEQDSQSE